MGQGIEAKSQPLRLFLSYCFDDDQIAHRVYYYLSKQPALSPYYYGEHRRPGSWREQIGHDLGTTQVFVCIVGRTFGGTQRDEALAAEEMSGIERVVVALPGAAKIPSDLLKLGQCDPIVDRSAAVNGSHDPNAQFYARKIFDLVKQLRKPNLPWVSDDDLPIGYPFDYEKDIVRAYALGGGRVTGELLDAGCPEYWPSVRRFPQNHDNPVPLESIGKRRPDDSAIIVDARARYVEVSDPSDRVDGEQHALTLPEAGPRERLRFPTTGGTLRVGVLVSGGIAPGINAVVAGIVERHELYRDHFAKVGTTYKLEIIGYRDGFSALLQAGHYRFLDRTSVRKGANLGGTLLGTSRVDPLLQVDKPEERDKNFRRIIHRLDSDDVEILYVIGGDGSMRAAHALSTKAQEMRDAGEISSDLSIVGIPKTMDNDILWVWQSFGFLSAVQEAREAILKLDTEAKSNPRLCVVQLFGSDSGFVVSHAALASGVCNAALIPEVTFCMRELSHDLCDKLKKQYDAATPEKVEQSPYGMILMAEAAIPVDAQDYLDDPELGLNEREQEAISNFVAAGRRVRGQTPDELRTAGLKIVSRVLERDIRKLPPASYWKNYRVFTNEPRHLVRAIPPSVSDVISGQRLGSLAVDNAMAGYTDFMVSQWLTEYVLVPLSLVVLGRKRVPKDGIFWKTVLANTGQPASLLCSSCELLLEKERQAQEL